MSIYRQWGLEPIINASGMVTRLGGATLPVDVLSAFSAAAAETVPLEALQAAASRKIAEATGAEAGLITSGAAAALTMGAAAILAGNDAARMERLPHCDGFPHEFLIAREQRSGYDHAVRAAGAVLVEVGFNEIIAGAGVRRTEAWEYAAAISPRTAGIVYVFHPESKPRLKELVEVAQARQLPVLVDAAGELPPRSNLRSLIDAGADLVSFSGGKSIRGPQSTGILCGRRDLIASAAVQMLDMDDHPELWDPPAGFIDRSRLTGMPRHGIGRGFKVAKEQIAALLTALELFRSGAYDAEIARCRQLLGAVMTALEGTHSQCRLLEGHDESTPRLEVTIDEGALGRTAYEVCRRLRRGSPPVYVGHGRLDRGQLVVDPSCVPDTAASALSERLRAELC